MVGVDVRVGSGVKVGVEEGVSVGVGVRVMVGVLVDVPVAVRVGEGSRLTSDGDGIVAVSSRMSSSVASTAADNVVAPIRNWSARVVHAPLVVLAKGAPNGASPVAR